jgi:hypothetical protein
VATALERHYRPVKLNLQMLGNAVPHLHTHLLPRFAADPAPGRPLPFPEGERPEVPETCSAGTRWRCGPWSDRPELRVGDRRCDAETASGEPAGW